MGRELYHHKIDVFNREYIKVVCTEEHIPQGTDFPIRGDAYEISSGVPGGSVDVGSVRFHKGAVDDGVHGISNEALLSVVIDRLQCFQRGPFSCRENALALTKIEEAMHWFGHRARASGRVSL